MVAASVAAEYMIPYLLLYYSQQKIALKWWTEPFPSVPTACLHRATTALLGLFLSRRRYVSVREMRANVRTIHDPEVNPVNGRAEGWLDEDAACLCSGCEEEIAMAIVTIPVAAAIVDGCVHNRIAA